MRLFNHPHNSPIGVNLDESSQGPHTLTGHTVIAYRVWPQRGVFLISSVVTVHMHICYY